MILMLEKDRVRVATTIPRLLDIEWRKFIQEKYGVYHKGMMGQVLEDSLKHYMKCYKKDERLWSESGLEPLDQTITATMEHQDDETTV